jgi:hypothetical protein
MQVREREYFSMFTQRPSSNVIISYILLRLFGNILFYPVACFLTLYFLFFYKSFHLDADFVYIYTQTPLRFDARSPSRSLIKLSLYVAFVFNI